MPTATQLLPLQPGTLPPGICFSDEQTRLNAFMNVSKAVLAGGYAFYNFGPDKPAVANQGWPWFRTTDSRWYYFSGQWRSSVNYSIYERKLFVGTLDQLVTFDGGDSGPAGDVSGPMWVEDTDFQGRSPMHPGDIPASNPDKTLSVAENFGEGAHTQTTDEMAVHTHGTDPTLADGFLGHAVAGAPATLNVGGGGDTIKMGATGEAGGASTTVGSVTTSTTQAAPVVHPVRGIYIVKWSGRNFYVVN